MRPSASTKLSMVMFSCATPRAFAASGLLGRKGPATETQAILLPTTGGAEFLIFRGTDLTWARTFPPAANLTSEIRRTLLVLAGQNPDLGQVSRVLAPPSLHPTGRRYAWSVDSASAFAAAPAWLLSKLTAGGGSDTRAAPSSTWRELVGGVAEGARDCSATRLAGHLLRDRIDPFVGLELLQGWNATRCDPPLPEIDIERIVASIARKELQRRGHG